MDSVQWYDYFRLATSAIDIWAMWRLAYVIRHRSQTYSTRLKDFLWLIFAYLFTQSLAALETVAANGPYKYSIFLSLFTACVAVRATRKSDEPLIT